MIKEKKTITFICAANYCRSPVAEALLINKCDNLLKVNSAGINPIISAGMDPRSISFLKEKNISPKLHNPKKVDKNLFNASNLVFAMDTNILMQLNKTFKHDRNKIKLFTQKQGKINIMDPYRLSDKKYKKVMEDINTVIEIIDWEEFS